MAELAVVTALTEKVLSMIAEKLFEEASMVIYFRKDFEFICEELFSIKGLLNEAGEKTNSSSMSNWIERLEDFLVDAEDVVEDCGVETCNPIFRFKMGRRINKLKDRISNIHRSAKYLK